MTEFNKKRKIDDNNQINKDEKNYHPFVRSTKKRDVLPVSPNNYLNNVKQFKKYIKEEEEKEKEKEKEIKKKDEIENDIEMDTETETDINSTVSSIDSLKRSIASNINVNNTAKNNESVNEINNNPFISPLLYNKKAVIIETEYELRKKIKELKQQLDSQKLDYELKLSELNGKYLEEHMNLEHNIDTLRMENIDLKKMAQNLDLEKQNLETTRRILYEKEVKSKDTIKKLEEELTSLKNKIKLELHKSNKESISLKEALFNSEQNLNQYKSENELNIDSIRKNFKNYEEEISFLKTELEKRTNQLNENMLRLKEVEDQYKDTQLENKKLKQNGTSEEMKVIKKELQYQIKYIREMERKNKELKKKNEYYKEKHENIDILKETIKTLENKVKAMKTLHEKICQLEIENSKLSNEHIKWASFLEDKDYVEFSTPQDLAKTLADQRIECALLKQKEGEFNAKIASQQEYINDLENKINELNSKYQKEHANNQNNLKIISYKEKSKELTQRRIDILQEQLNSYDLEEMNMKNHDDDTKKELERKNSRINELEGLLNEYQNRIYELENEKSLSNSKDSQEIQNNLFKDDTISNYSKKLTLELLDAEKEIQYLKKEKSMLEKENNTLDKLVTKLELSLGRGEYNPETTRVVQFANNPELEDYAIRKATLDALRNENKALLEIIKKNNLIDKTEIEMESGNMKIDSDKNEHIENIPIETYKRLEIENKKMKDLEKQLDRLKTVFRKKSKEYREVVYSLLGYRFDFLQDGRVKLTSMYSQKGNQSFVFASNSNDSGSMQLTGGGKSYIESLDKKIDYYVGQYGSIPGLLASVTLDLFNQLKDINSDNHTVDMDIN